MKPSEKVGWTVIILVSTIVFSLIASDSDDWYSRRVRVQEAVYEYVPTSQTQIIVYWVGATALSLLIGAVIGMLIHIKIREEEKEHE